MRDECEEEHVERASDLMRFVRIATAFTIMATGAIEASDLVDSPIVTLGLGLGLAAIAASLFLHYRPS